MRDNTTIRGIEEIFREVYLSNISKVRFFAYHYLKDHQEARCVAQDVFVTLWENREILDFEKNVTGYILVITKNKCLNILRHKKSERNFNNYKRTEELHDYVNIYTLSDKSSTNLYSGEIDHIIKETLEKMPANTREAFLLNRVNKLKYNEIAEKQGVSEKTVEYRIMSALKHLRRRLKDYLTIFLF